MLVFWALPRFLWMGVNGRSLVIFHGHLSVVDCFHEFLSIVIFRGLCRRHATHQRAITAWRNHLRPQRHTVQSKADAGESEDGESDVVKQHRGDQSSRGAALRVPSRKPTSDTQRK